MSVEINYKNTFNKKNSSKNIVFFVDEKFDISLIKKHILSSEYSFISDLLKISDLKNEILSFNINSKKKIILVSLKKNQKSVDIENIDKRIKDNILSNNNFFIFENNKKVSIVLIEKSFETFNGLNANIYSVKSKLKLTENDLKCNNLSKLGNKADIINKEYKFIDLNNEIKTNLININDYIKFNDNEESIYIILCNIKFDKNILNNLNLNKLINLNVDEIENKFIKDYSEIYNLVIIND